MAHVSVLVISLLGMALLAASNQATILKVDHATVCGDDLDALRAAFTGIGLTPDFGGPHGNGVTQMALIGFDDGSYLELIAPVKKDDPKLASSSEWAKFIVGNAGPCAWAMGSSDIHSDVERLKKAGALIVADEVQAGLGRSGSHMWAFQRLGANPDIVVMGKPMGNGHPIGVVVARKEIVDAFYASDRYFNTFAGNPVSCAVGLAVLDVLEGERLQENARKMGDRIRMGLDELAGRFSIIGERRGKGLLLGIEIVETKGDKQIPAGRHARWIINEMCRHGVLVGLTGANRNERNVLKIRPPMVFDESGVELLLSTLNAVLARVPTDFRE